MKMSISYIKFESLLGRARGAAHLAPLHEEPASVVGAIDAVLALDLLHEGALGIVLRELLLGNLFL